MAMGTCAPGQRSRALRAAGLPEGGRMPQTLQHDVEEAVVEARVVAQATDELGAEQVRQVALPGDAAHVRGLPGCLLCLPVLAPPALLLLLLLLLRP